jgi:hypothetical protein
MPVSGVTTYLKGSPKMSAAVSGTNEFAVGNDASLKVIVQNSGINEMEFLKTGTIDRDEVPTTAKLVTVGLGAGSAPIIVKTDPQTVGDIKSTEKVAVTITIKVLSDAMAGEYQVPLTIGYTYLASSQQEASDYVMFQYSRVTETVPLTIRIRPEVKIEVVEAVPENLNAGSEGYLTLTVKNTGSDDGRKATVKILRNADSPVIPTDSSLFIGDFPRGGTAVCRYKVSVSGEAEKQTYPLDVVVTYENQEGDIVMSAQDTIGIPVGGKIRFGITSGPVQVTPGSEIVIAVEYQNHGDTTAYHAQSRLAAVDPFRSSDNTAYLGDLGPGEKATAFYKIAAAGGTAINDYSLDTEIRYRDALDNSQVSETFRVRVQVLPKPVSFGPLEILLVAGLPAALCTGAGYYLLVMRKKK